MSLDNYTANVTAIGREAFPVLTDRDLYVAVRDLSVEEDEEEDVWVPATIKAIYREGPVELAGLEEISPTFLISEDGSFVSAALTPIGGGEPAK